MKFTFFDNDTKRAGKYLQKFFAIKIVKYVFLFLIILILSPFALFFFLRPQRSENISYGITFSNKYAQELGLDWKTTYIALLDELGVKNIRLVAYWDETEPQKDLYDFSNIRWQLDEAEKRDLSVILTVGRKVPRYPECFEPEWWKQIESEDIRNQELLEYLKVAVTEMKGYTSIKYWQVENEAFFPFGTCFQKFEWPELKKEVELVRSLDKRPILTQDSGEGGFWYPSYSLGDYLGISMYRKIWYDFWGAFFGNFIYFRYPLAHWSYKIRAEVLQVPYNKIFVTELQAEPWGPGSNAILSKEEKDKTMSRHDFLDTILYAEKTGFSNLYLWGAEWWYFEKEKNGDPFFWDTAKALFN